jgi:hypothetical protein
MILQKKSLFFLFGLISLLVASINALTGTSVVLGLGCLVAFLFSITKLQPKQPAWMSLLTALCSISILGSILYYAGPVTTLGLLVVCTITLVIVTIATPATSTNQEATHARPYWGALLAVLIFLSAWWIHLLSNTTTSAVRTPWHLADPRALILIGLATFIIITYLTNQHARYKTLTTQVLFASVLCVTAVLYPLGYGFDPFIHQATLAHILEFGTITPKPLYYIGQYAIELTASNLFTLPLLTVDRFLVILLTTIFIPTAAVFSTPSHRGAALTASLLLPLSAFINTTPQALSFLFTTILVLVSLPVLRSEKPTPFWLLALLATAALITHPLAGIPAVLYVVTLFLTHRFASPLLTGLSVILSAFAIPVVFLLQAALSGLPISIGLHLHELPWSLFLANHYEPWLDLLYLGIHNFGWLLLLFVVGSLCFVKNQLHATRLPLYFSAAWFVSYLLLRYTLQFDFLIEYERTNYANRLLTLAHLFLLPQLIIGFSWLFSTFHAKPLRRTAWSVLLTLLITANVYGAYPRHDNYARSAGFNVSQTDINTVYAIDDYAGDDPFVVLANQAVSAAALQAFGFKQYFEGDIFYYPIPTGGTLYQHYLSMADKKPTKETVTAVMDLTHAETVFFVLNDYWWNSAYIAEEAKAIADDWFYIDDTAIFVFTKNTVLD